jgi:hypothetical protein
MIHVSAETSPKHKNNRKEKLIFLSPLCHTRKTPNKGSCDPYFPCVYLHKHTHTLDTSYTVVETHTTRERLGKAGKLALKFKIRFLYL